MQQYPSQDELDVAGCTLLWGLLQNKQLSLYWVGGEEVYLVRNGRIIEHTLGHSIARATSQQGIQVSDSMRDIAYRFLSAKSGGEKPDFSQEKWEIHAEDYMVLLTPRIVNRMQDNDLLEILNTHDIQQAAIEFVDLTRDLDYRFGVAAPVIQFLE